MKRFLAILTLTSLAGCSSAFYYPSRALFHDPAALKLKPKEIFFQSADGTRLFAWHLKNKSGHKPKALVLQYHGNAENLSSHYLSLAWLLDHGYDLLTFDYRGYGRSDGEPSQEGTVADGEAALRLAKSLAEEIPIIVYGQSLGGAIALRNVIDLKNEVPIKLTVIESSFPSYQKMARKVMSRSLVTWPFQWMAWLVVSDARAPGDEISTISPIPLLVIHGTDDRTVEFELGEDIFSRATPPKEFWRVQSAGHLDVYFIENKKYRAELLKRWEKFL